VVGSIKWLLGRRGKRVTLDQAELILIVTLFGVAVMVAILSSIRSRGAAVEVVIYLFVDLILWTTGGIVSVQRM